MANEEHVEIVKQGADAIEKWRMENPGVKLILSGADLSGIDLMSSNLIGRRLKQTGARWRIQRVNRMAGLYSVMYSNQWEDYWNTLAT